MVKCISCGWIGGSEDFIRKPVYAGEYQGQAAFEMQSFCPECGMDDFHDCEEEDDDEQSYS